MSGPMESHAEVAARDDAHLRSLGIKPELRRSLGFLANFAVAFSYISVATGTFTNQSVAFGVGGPAIFWAWPLVILGQTFVALNFAELASHFPVAGSIYQWSKRLSNRTLGWFTGWIYFWAGVVTVTAVAATVPLVLSTVTGFDLAGASPIPGLDLWQFTALAALVTTTAINVIGVRLLAFINNIGVAAEIIGMLFFALILLFFFNHQPISIIFDTSYTSGLSEGGYFPVFLVGAFMALFVVYGFDTAGTFGEETLDASRQAPRGVLSAIWLSGIVGAIFLLAVTLSFKDVGKAVETGQAFLFPIADTILENLNGTLFGTFTLGQLYLVVILVAVYVCTLAIQGATVRLMFSMGRDRRLPFGNLWAHVSPTLKTPSYASLAVGVLAAVPIILTGALGSIYLAIAATGTIYLSYFLCNLGVLAARRRGWPHKGAWFKLGSWGTILNILALVWGGAMIINIGLWADPMFGVFGSSLRSDWSNPFIDAFITFGGNPIEGLPHWPVFESLVGAIILVGAIYYVVAQRGREDRVEADIATGEAVIG
ncbi:MAG TPA: amino acid permease [Candidatus Polarisedimenticolia bacterium]|nr:amino acid permease [Candidatus Polarisedimenticolia bacterium]